MSDTEQRTLRTILGGLPGILALKNQKLVYEVVNPQFCQFLAVGPAEIVGKTDEQLFAPAEAAAAVKEQKSVLSSGIPRRAELQFTGKDGARWFDVAFSAVLDDNGDPAGVMLSGHDITVLKQREASAGAAEDRVQQAEASAQAALEKLRVVHEEAKALEAAAQQVQDHLKQREKQLAQALKQTTALEAQLKDAQDATKAAEARLLEAEANASQVEARVSAAEARAQQAESKAQQLDTRVVELEARVVTAEAGLAEAEARATALDVEASALRTAATNATAELSQTLERQRAASALARQLADTLA